MLNNFFKYIVSFLGFFLFSLCFIYNICNAQVSFDSDTFINLKKEYPEAILIRDDLVKLNNNQYRVYGKIAMDYKDEFRLIPFVLADTVYSDSSDGRCYWDDISWTNLMSATACEGGWSTSNEYLTSAGYYTNGSTNNQLMLGGFSFDLVGLSGTVSDVKFSLYANGYSSGISDDDDDVIYCEFNPADPESYVANDLQNVNEANIYATVDIDSYSVNPTYDWYEVDLDADSEVQSALNDWFSVAVATYGYIYNDEPSGSGERLYSLTVGYANSANVPYLTITFSGGTPTPTPTATTSTSTYEITEAEFHYFMILLVLFFILIFLVYILYNIIYV